MRNKIINNIIKEYKAGGKANPGLAGFGFVVLALIYVLGAIAFIPIFIVITAYDIFRVIVTNIILVAIDCIDIFKLTTRDIKGLWRIATRAPTPPPVLTRKKKNKNAN